MTTVAELIEKLKEMPQDLPISLHAYEINPSYSIRFSKINLEKKSFTNPNFDSDHEQTFVVLNQKGIIIRNDIDDLKRLVYKYEDESYTITDIDSLEYIEEFKARGEKLTKQLISAIQMASNDNDIGTINVLIRIIVKSIQELKS